MVPHGCATCTGFRFHASQKGSDWTLYGHRLWEQMEGKRMLFCVDLILYVSGIGSVVLHKVQCPVRHIDLLMSSKVEYMK